MSPFLFPAGEKIGHTNDTKAREGAESIVARAAPSQTLDPRCKTFRDVLPHRRIHPSPSVTESPVDTVDNHIGHLLGQGHVERNKEGGWHDPPGPLSAIHRLREIAVQLGDEAPVFSVLTTEDFGSEPSWSRLLFSRREVAVAWRRIPAGKRMEADGGGGPTGAEMGLRAGFGGFTAPFAGMQTRP